MGGGGGEGIGRADEEGGGDREGVRMRRVEGRERVRGRVWLEGENERIREEERSIEHGTVGGEGGKEGKRQE